MAFSEYLWLEERVKISDSVPSPASEWAAWPGKCLFHNSGVEAQMKGFIQNLQGSLLPDDEKLYAKLEDILCCCGNRSYQRSADARNYGYTTGVNLPQSVHEELQDHLIRFFHNVFNASSVDSAAKNCASKVVKFLNEVLESHRYRIYNPSIVRFLHIIKQYLNKPLVQCTEFPAEDFTRLVCGPFWEDCAQKLRGSYCCNVYVDFNSDLLHRGLIAIYIEGPSLHEVDGVKTCIADFIHKTINPTEKSQDDENEVEHKAGETSTEKRDESVEEKRLDKKRDSKSVDRTLPSTTDSVHKDFTRSKSVPASAGVEVHDVDSALKRAKYNSECSDVESSPMEELTLFKEHLSSIIMQRLEPNDSVVNS